MSKMLSLYLLQHVLADLRSHHRAVVQNHKKKKKKKTEIDLHFTNTKCDILSSCLLFHILE